jgi:hypothetical protein
LTFQGEGSQTPEPGTLMTLGSVVALAGMRLLKRKRC